MTPYSHWRAAIGTSIMKAIRTSRKSIADRISEATGVWRQFLTEDRAIFISIDDTEVATLRLFKETPYAREV
jgi:hypothetical protein